MTSHADDLAQQIDGAELLDQVEAAICSYVVLPNDHTAAAVVLWVAATHAVPAWNTAPGWSSRHRRSAAASPVSST